MANQIKPEIWKTIKDFPAYAVSSYGRIKRILPGAGAKVERILKLQKNKQHGYITVGFTKRTVMVHLVVLKAFLGHSNGRVCNHLDGNKHNNHIDNLEWTTQKENIAHSYQMGLAAYGEKRKTAKLTTKQVSEIRELWSSGQYLLKELASRYNVSLGLISHITHYRAWNRA